MFINIFGKDPASLNHLSDFQFDHYYSGELFSIFLAKFNAFLSAFSFTESNDSLYDRLVGIRYLETILKNTAVIANKMPVPLRRRLQFTTQLKAPLRLCLLVQRVPGVHL